MKKSKLPQITITLSGDQVSDLFYSFVDLNGVSGTKEAALEFYNLINCKIPQEDLQTDFNYRNKVRFSKIIKRFY